MNPDMKRLKLLAAIAVLGIPLAACEEATPPPPVGSIVGTVSIEGTGIDGVSVNLSNGNSTTTAGGGSYRFDNVEGGAYTVTISGFPSDATFDATSAAATIASAGQSVTVNFTGAYIRTASVMGTVTVENMGLPGVTVMLTGVSSASAVTDDNGQYAFTGLRMGSYSVEISGFDSDEVGFSATAAAVSVGVGESKIVSFDGTYLRTAGIMGRVSVEGEGLEGVTVSLSGGPDATDMTTMTDAAGQYSFAKLRAGDYAVGISGYDTDDYEFEVTSQNVTVALGETASVPFEGVLLRTSGISGRVSVEGMGLEGIPVMLSMGDEAADSAMTDAGGLYAFSGLAAGDYTVSIMVESEAYVFESMSMDVTVGDDMTEIANFEGMHARTASVSGMLFIDELMKNDMYDEGEHPLPHAGVPVVLVGPGVNDQVPSATDSTGAYSFMGLKAGDYQLVVPVTGPMGDFAYGGSPTGYTLSVGVGEAVMQNIPVDITHTTVHFGVTLKNGDDRGMPLPGAMVTLYADAMGETKVGEGMTMVDEETMHAVASIRIAREGTTGNMVHAGVSADSAYTVADGMTAVMWDPQMTHTMGANANDIVNLNVDATVGGATITTDYGGGDALGGWAFSVAHGDTMYADTLDADGMGAFKMTVDSAGALPATYTFSVDTIQDNKLDGGEKFEGTSVDYVHTGLALAGTMDAGTMEVNYTTQSLVVGAHHERDQVMGYTGNVLDGDERDAGTVSLAIRYIDDNGRSRSFTAKEWNPSNRSAKEGVTTFTGLPADADIIVQASVAEDAGVMLLDPDELAAYTGTEANGIMGGHFGAHGGYSHTVSLCPLQAVDPTAQDHDECSSFAYVSTYSVTGLVWKNQVLRSTEGGANDDGFLRGPKNNDDPTFLPGISVGLAPVEGKNLAGEAQSFTTAAAEVKGNTHPDDTHSFAFPNIAAGVYKLTVQDGWRVRMGIKDATAMVGNAFNPLAGDVSLDVTPATTTVYGYVRDSDEFPVEDVTVTVNGVAATTDVHGRYIAEYVPSANNKRGNAANLNTIAVQTAHEGSARTDTVIAFMANDRIQQDVEISGVSKTASISGTVTASGGGTPIAGVRIMVDGLTNFNAKIPPSSAKNNALVTGADGTYTAIIEAKDIGESVTVTPSKDGYSFGPGQLSGLPAHAGSEISGINFTGFLHARITGRVRDTDGTAMRGVEVTATKVGGTDAADEVSTTSNARGTFVLSVPFGDYDIAASADDFTFAYPNDNRRVNAAPGQTVSYGDIRAMTFAALNVTASRVTTTTDGVTTVTENVAVNYSANDSTALPEGYDDVAYTIQTNTGTDGAWTDQTLVGDDGETPDTVGVTGTDATDGGFMVRVVAVATDNDQSGVDDTGTAVDLTPDTVISATAAVGAINPMPTDVTARRQNAADSDAAADTGNFIRASWTAVTNERSAFRLVAQVTAAEAGGVAVWVVLREAGEIEHNAREATYDASAATQAREVALLEGGTGTEIGITAAEFAAAITIAVEWVQGDPDEDNPWQRVAVPLAAKPAG